MKYLYDMLLRKRLVGFCVTMLGAASLLQFSMIEAIAQPTIPHAKDEVYRDYMYDDKGRLARVLVSDSHEVEYSYDNASRLERLTYKLITRAKQSVPREETIRYRYDKAGDLTGVENSAVSVEYAYDNMSRITEVRTSDGKGISYKFDPWGRIERMTFAGQTVHYGYDILDHVLSVGFDKGNILYEYKGDNREIVRQLPNGVTTTYTYSSLGELLSIRHLGPDGKPIQSFRYGYFPDGRLKRAEESSPSGTIVKEYEYDLLGRMKKYSSSVGEKEEYEYDALGNRVAFNNNRGRIEIKYDHEGRLISYGGTEFSYDRVGNIILKKQGNSETAFSYDAANRLIEVRIGKSVISFVYDGEGNRIRKTGDGRQTSYLIERVMGLPQVLAEYDVYGKTVHRHILVPSRVAQQDSKGRTIYLLEDRLGSTRSVVDEKGQVLAQYDYSRFGVPRLVEGMPQTNFLFAGEQWDEETHLIYLRARYYDPSVGRFVSPDPMPGSLLNPQTFNQYTYADNDPVNRIDSLGMFSGLPPPPPPQWRYTMPDLYEDLRYMSSTDNYWRPSASSVERRGNQLWVTYPPRSMQGDASAKVEIARTLLKVSSVAFALYKVTGGSSQTFFPLLNFVPNTPPVVAGRIALLVGPDLIAKGAFHMVKSYGPSLATGSYWKVLSHMEPYAYSLERGRKAIWSPVVDASRNIVSAFKNLSETRRDGSSVSALSPVIDRQRNIFLPPPGGGASSVPSVGGVYLDQSAKILGEIGAVTGAIFDSKTGQLILIGDKTQELPSLKPEYLAAAIRSVFSSSQYEPGMSIDPHPENPLASTMLVRFFGNTENTRLGWIMFESDRVMKGYSIGADNILRQKVTSRVAGYRSVTDMALADPKHTGELWSRFWLVPEPVIGRASSDGKAIIFEPVKMRVRTETMRLDGGRLVSAGGLKDMHSEAFAEHLTNYYEDFARETPVFAELKSVATAVALAKWMKEQNIPVYWNFVKIYAGDPYPTPNTTPSVVFEKTRTATGGGLVEKKTMLTFGGVDMNPQIQTQKDTSLDKAVETALQNATSVSQDASPHFTVDILNRKLHGVVMPMQQTRELGSYSLAETDLPTAVSVMGQLPGLTRYYNSFHNQHSEFGYSWTLLLPRLEFEAVAHKGQLEELLISGKPGSRVPMQKFVLTDGFGLGEERFSEPFIDHGVNAIGFKPVSASGRFRGIYPEDDGTYRVVGYNKEQALFDDQGRLRVLLTPESKTVYGYSDASGQLMNIRFSRQGKPEEEVNLEYDDQGRLKDMSWRGARATYSYDQSGNLKEIRNGAQRVSYEYDDKRLLKLIKVDDRPVVRNAYDTLGRLIEQKDAAGNRIRREFAKLGKDSTAIKYIWGDQWIKMRFDSDFKPVEAEDSSAGLYKISLTKSGNKLIETVQGPESGSRIELTPDGRITEYCDARGRQVIYGYSLAGLLSEIKVNGKRVREYQYDADGRLLKIAHDGGALDQFTYKEGWRYRQLKRISKGGQGSVQDIVELSDDPSGRTSVITHPSFGRIRLVSQGNLLSIAQGDATTVYRFDTKGNLQSIEGPEKLKVHFGLSQEGDLKSIELSSGGRTAKLNQQADGTMFMKGFDGAETTYKFNTQGLLVRVEDAYRNTTSYDYAEQGTLRRITLPNGRCINFAYEGTSEKLKSEHINQCR